VSVPSIIVVVPVEGDAYAHLDCVNIEEERRLVLDLERRPELLAEIGEALVRLFHLLAFPEGDS
jgi:hypothetical protein